MFRLVLNTRLRDIISLYTLKLYNASAYTPIVETRGTGAWN